MAPFLFDFGSEISTTANHSRDKNTKKERKLEQRQSHRKPHKAAENEGTTTKTTHQQTAAKTTHQKTAAETKALRNRRMITETKS